MTIRACLFLLAGNYALQLSSFAAIIVLLIAIFMLGRWQGVLLFVTGSVLFHMAATAVIDARVQPAFVGDSIVVTVLVSSFPVRRGPTTSFDGEIDQSPWVPRRIRVSWFDAPDALQLGDVWQVELRLRRPRGNSNPGVFDYETWLFRERIAATAYVVDGPRNRLLGQDALGPIERMRKHTVARLNDVVAEERAAVMSAISVGARHGITTAQWDRFARTGTSHLMAISGLHVGLVAAAGYYVGLLLSGLFARRSCHQRHATLLAVSLASAYAFVAGLAVPAQRAALMIALGAFAILMRRELRPFNVIACACVLLVIGNPVATLAPGFKLSFLAVVVLLLLARGYGRRFKLAAAQLRLFFGLAPLVAIEFGRISVAAPFINLVVVPLFSVVTVPATLLGALGWDWPLHVAAASLTGIEKLIAVAAASRLASWNVAALDGIARLLLLAPLAWVVLPPGWPGRCVAWVGVVALIVWVPEAVPEGCVDVRTLDVGQGLAIVVETRSQVLVYDTGPAYRGGGDAASSVLLPYLSHRAIRNLDILIVSHADTDHAGGFASVLSAYAPQQIYVGEVSADAPQSHRCVAGEGWDIDDVEFRFLWPQPTARLEGNDASCVLLVTVGDHRVLLPGDIENPAEQELVRSGELPVVDVVVVPHHGSTTSSTPAFVDALRADIAIMSAGFGNRWNLPDESVVERWLKAGARIYSTADHGAIGIRVCTPNGIVSTELNREQRRRLWHE